MRSAGAGGIRHRLARTRALSGAIVRTGSAGYARLELLPFMNRLPCRDRSKICTGMWNRNNLDMY